MYFQTGKRTFADWRMCTPGSIVVLFIWDWRKSSNKEEDYSQCAKVEGIAPQTWIPSTNAQFWFEHSLVFNYMKQMDLFSIFRLSRVSPCLTLYWNGSRSAGLDWQASSTWVGFKRRRHSFKRSQRSNGCLFFLHLLSSLKSSIDSVQRQSWYFWKVKPIHPSQWAQLRSDGKDDRRHVANKTCPKNR